MDYISLLAPRLGGCLLLLLFLHTSFVSSHAPHFNRSDGAAMHNAFNAVVARLELSVTVNGTFAVPQECHGSPIRGWWNSGAALTAVALQLRWRNTSAARSSSSAALLRTALAGAAKHGRGDFRPPMNRYNDDQLWWLWAAVETAAALTDPTDAALSAALVAAVRKGIGELRGCVVDACGGRSVTWSRRLEKTSTVSSSHNATTCVPTNASAGGYKASIANSLLMVVAARLHEVTGADSEARELAVEQWRWLNRSVMRGDGMIVDGVALTNCTLHNATYSYNQGVAIAGLVALHRTQGRSAAAAYLDAAVRIGRASTTNLFVDGGGVVREPCEGSGNCGCDGTSFRGPFVRGLADLYLATGDADIRALLNRTMSAALNRDCNAQWQFGLHWNGPNDLPLTTLTQMPTIDLFAAAYAAQFIVPTRVLDV